MCTHAYKHTHTHACLYVCVYVVFFLFNHPKIPLHLVQAEIMLHILCHATLLFLAAYECKSMSVCVSACELTEQLCIALMAATRLLNVTSDHSAIFTYGPVIVTRKKLQSDKNRLFNIYRALCWLLFVYCRGNKLTSFPSSTSWWRQCASW